MTEPDTPAERADDAGAADRQARLGRAVLYGFAIVLSCCVLFTFELWPFTSEQLFSRIRTGTQRANIVTAVNFDGERFRIQDSVVLYHTPDLPPSKVTPSLCGRWQRLGAEQAGGPVTDVRSERIISTLRRTDHGVEATRTSTTVRWRCPA